MRMKCRGIVIGAACAALLATSAAAAPSATAPAAPATGSANPWLTLSQMNATGAAVLGSAAVAAQPTDVPPPAPGVRVGDRDVIPWPVIGVWFVVIAAMIYIALQNDNHHHNAEVISPA